MPIKSTFIWNLGLAAIGIVLSTSSQTASSRETPDCSVADIASAPAKPVNADRFTVEVRGAGPDVMLIPGMGTPRAVWDDTVKSFAACYRVHSIQLRGFGDTAGLNASGPVIEPFVAELSQYIDEVTRETKKPMAVVGHSMGGLVGLKLAEANPKKISRLMMVDALPSFAATIPGLATADPTTAPAIIENAASQMRTVIAARHGKAPNPADIEASVAGMSLNPASIELLKRWSLTADQRVVAQAVYDDLVIDMRPKLTKIKTPVTVLAAWHSGMPFDEAQVKGFFERQFTGLNRVHIIVVPDSAHFIMLDRKQMFRALLDEFLRPEI